MLIKRTAASEYYNQRLMNVDNDKRYTRLYYNVNNFDLIIRKCGVFSKDLVSSVFYDKSLGLHAISCYIWLLYTLFINKHYRTDLCTYGYVLKNYYIIINTKKCHSPEEALRNFQVCRKRTRYCNSYGAKKAKLG